MPFKRKDCIVRRVYCGEGRRYSKEIYSRRGSRYECLKKGFGIGAYSNQKLKENSLQHIYYVGDYYEKRFKRKGVRTLNGLIRRLKPMSADEKHKFLKQVCKKSDGVIDQRVINSVLLFLHDNGVRRLPKCVVFKE